jgi:hypothetical protein
VVIIIDRKVTPLLDGNKSTFVPFISTQRWKYPYILEIMFFRLFPATRIGGGDKGVGVEICEFDNLL